MSRLPDGMVAYATYELSQKLLSLTAKQRDAVDVIVARHYIGGEPMAALFRGDDKICSERIYYNTKNGWAHNDAFLDALSEAARLALQRGETDRQRKLQAATDLAIDSAEDAVGAWVDVMLRALEDPRARNDAAQRLLDLAYKSQAADETEAPGSEAADWWEAVGDE